MATLELLSASTGARLVLTWQLAHSKEVAPLSDISRDVILERKRGESAPARVPIIGPSALFGLRGYRGDPGR